MREEGYGKGGSSYCCGGLWEGGAGNEDTWDHLFPHPSQKAQIRFFSCEDMGLGGVTGRGRRQSTGSLKNIKETSVLISKI